MAGADSRSDGAKAKMTWTLAPSAKGAPATATKARSNVQMAQRAAKPAQATSAARVVASQGAASSQSGAASTAVSPPTRAPRAGASRTTPATTTTTPPTAPASPMSAASSAASVQPATPKSSTPSEQTNDDSDDTPGVGVAMDPARVYRYPVYKPDRFCISAEVPSPPWYVRQIGRMYVLAERTLPDGTPKLLCVVGPCWPMICITLMLILCVSLSVFFACLPNLPMPFGIAGGVLLLVVVISFCITACTDPGIQRIHDTPKDSSWTFSDPAQTYRQPRAVYDVEAQVIIRHIDHFCPWTGTIIAANNLVPFYVFTYSLCALVLLVVSVVVVRGSGIFE